MKKIVLALIILFGLNAHCQTAKKPANSNKAVTNTLYTPKEKEDIKKRFLNEIEEIDMSPTVKSKYLEIINKNSEKLKAINKERSVSQTEISTRANKIIKDQNQEIKKILTPDQYKKHKIIYNKYQNSINYRIQQR
jgi:hypothetical protein